MTWWRRLWLTVVWQRVPGHPRVRWRGAGSPEDAAQIIAYALDGWAEAWRVVVGVDPPPLTVVWRIVFADRSDLGPGIRAKTWGPDRSQIAALPLGTDQPRRLASLVAHERTHIALGMAHGDMDRNHEAGAGPWTEAHNQIVRKAVDG